MLGMLLPLRLQMWDPDNLLHCQSYNLNKKQNTLWLLTSPRRCYSTALFACMWLNLFLKKWIARLEEPQLQVVWQEAHEEVCWVCCYNAQCCNTPTEQWAQWCSTMGLSHHLGSCTGSSSDLCKRGETWNLEPEGGFTIWQSLSRSPHHNILNICVYMTVLTLWGSFGVFWNVYEVPLMPRTGISFH